jgi:SAM-dependent methyltransferase
MKDKLNQVYNQSFYNGHLSGMSISASIVLKHLYQYYQPKSIIDIGCGQGAWLDAAESLGAKYLRGFDGDWIIEESLLSKNIIFTHINLESSMPEIDRDYDLCISLEVAEHLSERQGKILIDLLCEASNVVLFSAAVKNQGGTHHKNEQWQSYWINLFRVNGYECLDILRPEIWNNPSVKWWYRQNIFLFVDPTKSRLNIESLRRLEKPIYDLVHPKNYLEKACHFQNPSFRFCLRCIKLFLFNTFIKKK